MLYILSSWLPKDCIDLHFYQSDIFSSILTSLHCSYLYSFILWINFSNYVYWLFLSCKLYSSYSKSIYIYSLYLTIHLSIYLSSIESIYTNFFHIICSLSFFFLLHFMVTLSGFPSCVYVLLCVHVCIPTFKISCFSCVWLD